MYTLDTNALIYLIAGEESVVNFVSHLLERGGTLTLPTICEAEFFSHTKLTTAEKRDFERIMPFVRSVPLDSDIARLAGTLRGTYHAPLIDSVVAATALAVGATLLTRNIKDFKRIPELKVRRI